MGIDKKVMEGPLPPGMNASTIVMTRVGVGLLLMGFILTMVFVAILGPLATIVVAM